MLKAAVQVGQIYDKYNGRRLPAGMGGGVRVYYPKVVVVKQKGYRAIIPYNPYAGLGFL